MTYTIEDSAFIQTAIGYRWFRPSRPGSDWVVYRGFADFFFGGGFGVKFDSSRLFGLIPVAPGIAFRGYANYAHYSYTEIYYFYPSVTIELFTSLGKFLHDYVELRAGVPLEWNFQKDLDIFFSTGLSLRAVLYFPAL